MRHLGRFEGVSSFWIGIIEPPAGKSKALCHTIQYLSGGPVFGGFSMADRHAGANGRYGGSHFAR